jgi:hypothetical protein
VEDRPGQRGGTSRCPRGKGTLRVETTCAPIQAAGGRPRFDGAHPAFDLDCGDRSPLWNEETCLLVPAAAPTPIPCVRSRRVSHRHGPKAGEHGTGKSRAPAGKNACATTAALRAIPPQNPNESHQIHVNRAKSSWSNSCKFGLPAPNVFGAGSRSLSDFGWSAFGFHPCPSVFIGG